ncbi:MAG TPA: hypothetical protein VFT47_11745 [Vicinamibacterales bacterium]|nr:hypothetical protein [Vicinamibacterales bacterium]
MTTAWRARWSDMPRRASSLSRTALLSATDPQLSLPVTLGDVLPSC